MFVNYLSGLYQFCIVGEDLKDNKIIDWLLFGLFAALGILSKYLFIYLLVAMDIFFIYLIIKKKINFKCLISFSYFFIDFVTSLNLVNQNNNYITITYASSQNRSRRRLNFSESLYFIHYIFRKTNWNTNSFLCYVFI